MYHYKMSVYLIPYSTTASRHQKPSASTTKGFSPLFSFLVKRAISFALFLSCPKQIGTFPHELSPDVAFPRVNFGSVVGERPSLFGELLDVKVFYWPLLLFVRLSNVHFDFKNRICRVSDFIGYLTQLKRTF